MATTIRHQSACNILIHLWLDLDLLPTNYPIFQPKPLLLWTQPNAAKGRNHCSISPRVQHFYSHGITYGQSHLGLFSLTSVHSLLQLSAFSTHCAMKYIFLTCFVLMHVLSAAISTTESPGPTEVKTFNPNVKDGKATYMLTNVHEWESIDHQLTSLLTLITLADNSSAIPVIPPLLSGTGTSTNLSLIGDFFSAEQLRKLQKLITFREFLESPMYQALRNTKVGMVPLPKNSQEEYESQLKILGSLDESRISFPMPHEDVENTNQYCDTFPGTIFETPSHRFIFLERIHFFHFCTERFMPWWYNVRTHLIPRKPYLLAAQKFSRTIKRPITVIHIRDLMDMHRTPDNIQVERYARQIADAIRRHNALRGTLYLAYPREGLSVKRVASLLRDEFDNVCDCKQLYECGTKVPASLFQPALAPNQMRTLFRSLIGKDLVEWALSLRSDYFIGNIHSPYSRNIGIYRKLRGRSYSILKGFGEMRKVWTWNL